MPQTCDILFKDLNYYDQSQFVKSANSFNKQGVATKQNNKIKQQFNQISFEHTKQFDQLNQWINSQNNAPFIICSESNCGKKVFLCQYMNYCSKYEKKIIFLSHFACANNVYSSILYKIVAKLRMLFDITQKVQINEQKIRRYFKYWLQITSKIIDKQNIGYSKKEKKSVVIIIDGADTLTDYEGKKVDLQFWLPKQIPKNIKIVLTSNSSEIESKGKSIPSYLSHMLFSPQETIQKIKKQYLIQGGDHINLNLTQSKIVSLLCQISKSFKIQAAHKNFKDILEDYIQCSNQRHLSQKQIKSLLLCLTLTKKGLTTEELASFIKLSKESIQFFLKLYSPLLANYQNYYIIFSPHLKQLIQKICDPMLEKQKTYHQVMAKVMKKESCSIRKLEEQIYHLEKAEMFLQIKQILSQIQNFLTLYTPVSKFFLCLMWSKVQKHLTSDPVFQYNKGVQSFISHYYLKEQELYKIIFQLSMFFKQYSQFQNSKTPQFRHSSIRGDIQQLQKINVFNQMNQMGMTRKRKIKAKKNQISNNYKFVQNCKEVIVKQKISNKAKNKKQNRESQLNQIMQNQLQSDKILPSDLSQQNQLDFQIDQISVVTVLNQNKFKNYFLKKLQPYLRQFYLPYKKVLSNDMFLKTSSNQEDDEQQSTDFNISNLTLKGTQQEMILKQLDEYFQENYHRQETAKYYYYRQWLWVQFPWICQSFNYNFSQMIKKFIGTSTSYMSIQQQMTLISESLKISKVSKQNKSAIYQSRPIQLSSINMNKLKKKKLNSDAFGRRSIDLSQSKIYNQVTNSPNVAKFNLNLTGIDQKLNKQLQLELSHRKMYDSRVLRQLQNSKVMKNQMSVFLTQTKANCEQNNLKLPKLQKNGKGNKSINRFQIKKNSVQKQNQNRLTKDLNMILNENKDLTHKIEQIQKSSIMYDNIDQNILIQSFKVQIQKLQMRKKHILKQTLVQQNLKNKLQTIIKICDNNKRHQSESQSLNQYLQALKKMNQIEKNQYQTIKKSTQQNIKNLKKELQSLKNKKDKIIPSLSNAQQFNQSLKIKQKQNNKQYNQEARPQKAKNDTVYSKNLETRKKKKLKTTKILQKSSKRQEIEEFQRIFQQFGDKQKSQQILDSYQTKIQKLNEINVQIQEFQYEKQQKQQRLQQIKDQINSAQKKLINEKSSIILKEIRQKKNKLTIQTQRLNILQDAIKLIC